MIIERLKNGEIISEETVSKLLEYKDAVICFMSCASITQLKEDYKKKKLTRM